MTTRTWSDEYRTMLICVDSYQQGTLQGRFYNPFLNEGQSFQSLSQFITKMEQTLDGMEFPKAYTTTRTFLPQPEKPPGPPGTVDQNGNNNSCGLFQFGEATNAQCLQNGDNQSGITTVFGF